MSQEARLHTMPSRETDTMIATTPSPLPDPPAGSPGGLDGPRGVLHQLAPPSQASSAISRLLSLHPTFSCHQWFLSPRIFYTQGDLVHIPLNNHNDINKASNWTNGVHSHLADWIEDVRGHWYLTQTQLFFILWHSCFCLSLFLSFPMYLSLYLSLLSLLWLPWHFPKVAKYSGTHLTRITRAPTKHPGYRGGRGGVDLC